MNDLLGIVGVGMIVGAAFLTRLELGLLAGGIFLFAFALIMGARKRKERWKRGIKRF